jgi:hypothetical protein
MDERPIEELSPEELKAKINELIEYVLEGEPRAEQWREWRLALEERLRHILDMRSRGIVEFENLDELIKDLEEKIKVLREQEIITEFVEQQVHAIIGKVMLQKALEEELETS